MLSIDKKINKFKNYIVMIHKKPISSEPSKLLTSFAKIIAENASGLIVDIACGYGRNAFYLSTFGVPVLCVDNSKDSLQYIESMIGVLSGNQKNKINLTTLEIDLIHDPWPFKNESLGAIISVHFYAKNILTDFLNSLQIGGYFFIETISGRGGNYIDLPPHGFILETLGDSFEILHSKEKKVGPPKSNSATIKLFAKKIKSYKN